MYTLWITQNCHAMKNQMSYKKISQSFICPINLIGIKISFNKPKLMKIELNSLNKLFKKSIHDSS